MHEDDGYFDERVATRYDEFAAEMFDPAVVDPVIDLLVEIAGSGRTLELGIGTGRIALPLAQRGVPVHGIELSNAMVARLRAKIDSYKVLLLPRITITILRRPTCSRDTSERSGTPEHRLLRR